MHRPGPNPRRRRAGPRSFSLSVSLDLTDRPARPGDPLNEQSPRDLVRLARRADRARRRDRGRFEGLAVQAGIDTRRLRLLADAWDEGGAHGVQVLGPAPAEDPPAVARAENVVETWRRQHFPLDALDVQRWRNRVTVWWLRPDSDPTKPLQRQALMQLRRSQDGRWHLYRRAAQGEWWPVTVNGRRARQSLGECLAVVRADPLRQFWAPAAVPDPPVLDSSAVDGDQSST